MAARLRTVLAAIDPATQTRRAIYEVDMPAVSDTGTSPPPPVVDGQLVQLQLTEFVAEPGFWVPASAITSDHRGLWSCLTLEAELNSAADTSCEGIVRKQSVEVLHQHQDWLYVRGTLRDGQILVADGLHRLVPGQRITGVIDHEKTPPRVESVTLTLRQPVTPEGNPPTSRE